MNELQRVIFEVIVQITSVKDLQNTKYSSDVLYGLHSYVARYSLANDFNLASDKATMQLRKIKALDDRNMLPRSKKSRKNGFTYEHLVPANLISKEILKHRSSPLNKIHVYGVITR